MAKFTVNKNVEKAVLPMVVGPTVHIARQVAQQAKENAPPLKNWVSQHDPFVRPEHVEADLDKPVPENLRFKLRSTQWDREHRAVGPFSYIKQPPFEGDSRAFVLMVNCRCRAVRDADGIRKLIDVEQPIVQPLQVRVNVVCQGDYVVDSEFGTVYPGDLPAVGSFFMGRAAVQVAARRRSAQTLGDARKRVIFG